MGGEDTAGEQPLERRRPGLGPEAAGEGARTDVGVAGHFLDAEWLGEAIAGPRAGRLERAGIGLTGPADGLGRAEELRLAAVAMRRRDHVPGDRVGAGDAV